MDRLVTRQRIDLFSAELAQGSEHGLVPHSGRVSNWLARAQPYLSPNSTISHSSALTAVAAMTMPVSVHFRVFTCSGLLNRSLSSSSVIFSVGSFFTFTTNGRGRSLTNTTGVGSDENRPFHFRSMKGRTMSPGFSCSLTGHLDPRLQGIDDLLGPGMALSGGW